jgi:hypothetical protein
VPDELDAEAGQVACVVEKHVAVPVSQHQVPVPTQVLAQSASTLHDPMQPELVPVPTPGLVAVSEVVAVVAPPPLVVVAPLPVLGAGLFPAPPIPEVPVPNVMA